MSSFPAHSGSISTWWYLHLIPKPCTHVLAFAVPAVMTASLVETAPIAPATTVAKPTCLVDHPDENAALFAARICGGPVAITGLTIERDKMVATAAGTVRWSHRYRPVRVRPGNTFTPIDIVLAARSGGRIAATAAAVGVAFSSGGPASLVTVTIGRKSFSVGSPWGAMPKCVRDGDTVTYRAVLPAMGLQAWSRVQMRAVA